MKGFCLALLILALSPAALSQTAPDAPAEAPGLSLGQLKWKQVMRHPALEDDPFRANDDLKARERLRREVIRENGIRARQGREPIRTPPQQTSNVVLDGITFEYVYEVSVVNTGDKPIRALVWEYVLFDPDTNQQVGKHAFMSKTTIQPGKSKKLTGRSNTPPSGVIGASKADKPFRTQYAERVVIHGIEYADGTVWARALK